MITLFKILDKAVTALIFTILFVLPVLVIISMTLAK
jgi:hypothetical protein